MDICKCQSGELVGQMAAKLRWGMAAVVSYKWLDMHMFMNGQITQLQNFYTKNVNYQSSVFQILKTELQIFRKKA